MDLTKFQLKVRTKTDFNWIHFCYLPTKIKRAFDRHVNNKGLMNNNWVASWAREDFGISRVDTREKVNELKEAIRAKYKAIYPELYIESRTDNQGWIRHWTTNHMMKELDDRGKRYQK